MKSPHDQIKISNGVPPLYAAGERVILTALALLVVLLPFMTACEQDTSYEGDYTVTVTAGSIDRTESIVSFPLPNRLDDGIYLMRSGSDSPVPLQVYDNRGRFLLERLNAGESKSYILNTQPDAAGNDRINVTGERDKSTLTFSSQGNSVLSYHIQESDVPDDINPRFRRAGYIHPVYSPSGAVVTRHFNPGRPHQYGIWSAWSQTQFQGRDIEFWAAHEDNGRVEADTLDRIWEGPVYGGFSTRHRFTDHSTEDPVTALNEEWKVLVYHTPRNENYHLFDVRITQTANSDNPVLIPEAGYGGISFRGPDEWDGEGLMDFISSEGLERSEVTNERIRWAHLTGTVEGSRAGITLLGHPENRNHPQGAFINQTEPFFSYGPAAIGDVLIEPGIPWTARYRFVVHDGEPDAEELERLWKDYAWPPAVTVTR